MKPIEIFSHWDQIRSDLLATIDKFEEGDLSYRAYHGCWCAGKIMLHIAGAEDGWFRYTVARELSDWPDHYTLENHPTTEAIKTALTVVHARTLEYISSLEENDMSRIIETPWGSSIPLGWIIWHVLEHEIHHRGELSLMLGMLGREGLDA